MPHEWLLRSDVYICPCKDQNVYQCIGNVYYSKYVTDIGILYVTKIISTKVVIIFPFQKQIQIKYPEKLLLQ